MRFSVSLLVVLTALVAGCTEEPALDTMKFAELDRAAVDLKNAIRSGRGCDSIDDVHARLASGTARLQDSRSSKQEHDLLSAYAHLTAISRDGQLLCRSRTLLSGFVVPRGRIYVSQELDPVVERYHLRTESHLYKPTGKYWKSISAEAIGVVWDDAEVELQHIENMVKYR